MGKGTHSGKVGLARLDEYCLCLLLHLVFPLAPLAIDWIVKHEVRPTTLLLGLAMYSFAIANSTRLKVLLGAFMLIGFVSGICYGAAEVNHVTNEALVLSAWSLGFIFITHAIERFCRHVLGDEVFLESFRHGE